MKSKKPKWFSTEGSIMLVLHENWGMRNRKPVVDGWKLVGSVTWHLGGLAVTWVHQTQHGGGISHSTLVPSQPLVLCAVLNGPVKEGHKIINVSREGWPRWWKVQGQDLRGVSEVTWLVQLRKEKAKGWHCYNLQLSPWGTVEGKMLISLMTTDRTEGNGNEAASGEAQIGH